MGRGNICPSTINSRVLYVDYDNLNLYTNKYDSEDIIAQGDVPIGDTTYEYDDILSQMQFDDFKDEFVRGMLQRYKSFTETNEDNIILENNLFTVSLEDNEWSVAVILEPKEQDYYTKGNYEMMQTRLVDTYYKGMQQLLLEQFEEIGVYGGPWTHGTIKREV